MIESKINHIKPNKASGGCSVVLLHQAPKVRLIAIDFFFQYSNSLNSSCLYLYRYWSTTFGDQCLRRIIQATIFGSACIEEYARAAAMGDHITRQILQCTRSLFQFVLFMEDIHLHDKYHIRSSGQKRSSNARHWNCCALVRPWNGCSILESACFILFSGLYCCYVNTWSSAHAHQGTHALFPVSNSNLWEILLFFSCAFSFSTKFHLVNHQILSYWFWRK